MLFVHDCDLSDQKLLVEKIPKANIKYGPNHFTKKAKRRIQKALCKNKDLKDVIEKVKKFISILAHDSELKTEEKKNGQRR